PWAVGDWAISDGTTWQRCAADGSLQPFTAFVTSPVASSWRSTDNVDVTGSVTASSDVSAYTMRFAKSGSSLQITNGRTIQVTGFLVDMNENPISSIGGSGRITTPTGSPQPLVVHAHGTGGSFRIGVPIT